MFWPIWLGNWKVRFTQFWGMTDKLGNIELPAGFTLNELYLNQPEYEDDFRAGNFLNGRYHCFYRFDFIGLVLVYYLIGRKNYK